MTLFHEHGERERVAVTVHGTPVAVLLAPEHLESLEEPIVVLSDTGAMRRLATTEHEIARAEGES